MFGARPKVLVAMSGGVDSSVAAALLLRDGYDVVGVFMRLGSPGEELPGPEGLHADGCDAGSGGRAMRIGKQGCCSVGDAADARLVAAELGIPFYVCNFKQDFGRIIDYFVDEYAAGRTPNPCVRCNDWLKFGKLHGYARQIGAAYVASGHYARVEPGPDGRPRLMRGVDHRKDQSYVLFGAPRDRLDEMLLPIGRYEKDAVRDMARRFGLPVFDKPDSQEICFVPDQDYAGLVERRRAGLVRQGSIVDLSGRVLGTHRGQHRFTIGQRRGLRLAAQGAQSEPVYVLDKDAAANTVVVGPRQRLAVLACNVGEANWLIDPAPLARWRPCLARYRSNAAPVRAQARLAPDRPGPTPSGRTGAFQVRFDAPQPAVAPGQALVLYDELEPDVVLGGGWIIGAEGRP